MKNLEEEQRKMRERMETTQRKKKAISTKSSSAASPEIEDVKALLERIELLEAENTLLRRQLAILGDQSAPQGRRLAMSESERRHLFMKYSNIRRY